jgi:hypothetical protein
MDQSELPKTVTTVLDVHNYIMWAQDMRNFLKDHRLWYYLTGDITPLVRSPDEDEKSFSDHLED